jgi:hypothetical protein
VGPAPSDPELTDTVLGEEIELLGALISRAAQAHGCLTDAQLDAVLFGAPEPPPAG